jgi:hypothetical protein
LRNDKELTAKNKTDEIVRDGRVFDLRSLTGNTSGSSGNPPQRDIERLLAAGDRF